MNAMEDRNGIPKFDLAEQILAEQRKNASVRRKGPANKFKPVQRNPISKPVDRVIQSQLGLTGQDQVIADIVARDIEMLCRSTA